MSFEQADPIHVPEPIILSAADFPQFPLSMVETDCACADDHFTPSQRSAINLNRHYVAADLHTDALPGEYTLAFNPVGNAGVLALNPSATALLNSFRRARRLADLDDRDSGAGIAFAASLRLAELGLLRPVDQPAIVQPNKPQTLTAWLHVTNECNLRCDYCYVHKTPDAMELEHGKQAVDAVFRSALDNGFRRIKLKYAGGEATLNFPLVVALHQYAHELAAEYALKLAGVILSNGVALGDRLIRGLRESGLRLMISLDGIGAVHDAQRRFRNGHGSFIHVERALDRLARHQITPSISITISTRNLNGLAETVAYVLDRGLPFSLNFFRENDCAASFADLAYHDDQVIGAMRSAFAEIERRLPSYSLLGALIDRARLDAAHDRPCGVGQSYLVVNHQGGVAKCHMEIEQAVTDISAPDPLRLIREDMIGLRNIAVEEKEGCRTCTWRYWCAGGCPALTYRVTGRYDVKSPNCRIYQALFPDVLRLEGLRLLRYAGVHAA